MKAGTKVNSEDPSKSEGFEIKLRHDGQVIGKTEFLEMIFENFKTALNFATKFRLSPNFYSFFEGDARPNTAAYVILHHSDSTSKHKTSPDEFEERKTTPFPPSRLTGVAYKNYKGEARSNSSNKKRTLYPNGENPLNKSMI